MIEDSNNPITLLFDSKKAVYKLAYHLDSSDILFNIDLIPTNGKECIYELVIDTTDEPKVKELIKKYNIKPPLNYKINI